MEKIIIAGNPDYTIGNSDYPYVVYFQKNVYEFFTYDFAASFANLLSNANHVNIYTQLA